MGPGASAEEVVLMELGDRLLDRKMGGCSRKWGLCTRVVLSGGVRAQRGKQTHMARAPAT